MTGGLRDWRSGDDGNGNDGACLSFLLQFGNTGCNHADTVHILRTIHAMPTKPITINAIMATFSSDAKPKKNELNTVGNKFIAMR